MLRDLIEKNRSYRRFQQDVAVDLQTLRELVDLARHPHTSYCWKTDK